VGPGDLEQRQFREWLPSSTFEIGLQKYSQLTNLLFLSEPIYSFSVRRCCKSSWMVLQGAKANKAISSAIPKVNLVENGIVNCKNKQSNTLQISRSINIIVG
jgi:hypothetical protein